MLEVTVRNYVVSAEEKKKGCSWKDLQKKKVGGPDSSIIF